jgi:nucleoside-diphosphate-sugar epimerase
MQAGKKIAVAGATGRVGRHVVDVLEAGGHDVVAMSRSRGVDVITRDGPPRRWQARHPRRPDVRRVARVSFQP